MTVDECARGCRQADFCTAFHILKPTPDDQKFDCLLFGHKEVVAVRGLGGVCYTFSDTPAGQEDLDDDDIGDEDEEPQEPMKIGEIFKPFRFQNLAEKMTKC